MIATTLSFPGKCVYSYTKETRTRSELATVSLALTTFSAAAAYFVPSSYTFAFLSVFTIYAGQLHEAKKEWVKIPHSLYGKIGAISLSIIIGAKIGQKIREHRCPMQNPGQWYSISLKTPLHLFNNILVYIVSPMYLDELIDVKAFLLPGQFMCRQMGKHQTNRDQVISLIVAFAIAILASYWVSFSYTFSSVIAITLFCGANSACGKSSTDEVPLHLFGSLYLFVLGSKIGRMVATYCFPASFPCYSLNWRIPFHIMNDVMIIGIPGAIILIGLRYVHDPRPILPDLSIFEKKTGLDGLKTRVHCLEKLKFELDCSIKSKDDMRAAHFILFSDPKWTRNEVRKNYKILLSQTHPDKNPGLDEKYNRYVTEAAKILGAN